MLESWIEWKRRCALERCGAGAKSSLRTFAYTRFARYLRAAPSGCRLAAPDAADAWQRFEGHLALHRTRTGKCYKDWLFSRAERSADSPLDVIQGGASLIMRHVVRDFLRRECAPSWMLSLDRNLAADGQSLTLLDVLSASLSPHDTAAQNEYERLGAAHAAEWYPGLTVRERVALAARHAGRMLNDPEVCAAAGCGKSVLCDTYRRLLDGLARRIRCAYPDEDPRAWTVLALSVVHAAGGMAAAQIYPEPQPPRCFRIEETSHETA